MEDKIKKLEEKVNVLQNKVNKLEKAERKRTIHKWINRTIKLIIIIGVIIGIYKSYLYLNKKYIQPYKEIIDKLEEKYDAIKDNEMFNWLTKKNKEKSE